MRRVGVEDTVTSSKLVLHTHGHAASRTSGGNAPLFGTFVKHASKGVDGEGGTQIGRVGHDIAMR